MYLLLQLVHEHPYMREVVATEVRQQLVKSDATIKSIYYGITFLNQIEFTVEDNEFALSLISFYFSLFNKYSVLTLEKEKKSKSQKGRMNKKNKKKAKEEKKLEGETNETRLKLIAAILTGINRALPYGKSRKDHIGFIFSFGRRSPQARRLSLPHCPSSQLDLLCPSHVIAFLSLNPSSYVHLFIYSFIH